MEIQQNRYETMQPIPAPEPYTLPLTLRKNRGTLIIMSVIFLSLIAAPVYYIAFANPPGTMKDWIMCFLLVAFFGLIYLEAITQKILLTEDRISYRERFFWREMEYSRITAVRCYHGYYESTRVLMLELAGDSGNTITLNLGPFDNPENRFIIYDVLKKKACVAGIRNSPEEFFTDPAETGWIRNMLPQQYTLPLTLQMDRSDFFFTPEVRLTEDRISYREKNSWKEMEYSRITVVRYYYQDTMFTLDSGPVLELSGDNGDTITMRFGMNPGPENLGIIYDVLKKKAPQAGLKNSPGVFFAHPGATAGS